MLLGWLMHLRGLRSRRLQSTALEGRAATLRAFSLAMAESPRTTQPASNAEQATYVDLMRIAQESGREAIGQGWSLVAVLLDELAEQQALPSGVNIIKLLNRLEHRKLLDFDDYSLLRDLHELTVDMTSIGAGDISSAAALDYAVAVRRALRLLSRLIAEQVRCPTA